MSAVLRISLQERNPSGDIFKLGTLRSCNGDVSFKEFQHSMSAESPAHFDLEMLQEKQQDGSSLRMITILKENSDLSSQIDPSQLDLEKTIDITLSNPDGASEIVQFKFEAVQNTLKEPVKGEPFLFQFSKFQFPNFANIVQTYQKEAPSNTRTSDLMLFLRCGSQEAAINLSAVVDQPHKVVLLATTSSSIDIRVEEHVYKLERDEAKMLKRLKETNLFATGVGGFLLQNAGVGGQLDKSKTQTLDSLIDKKRSFESSRVILTGQPLQISKIKITIEPLHELTYQMGKETLHINYKTSQNDFTKMPKGRMRLRVVGCSQMNLLIPQQGKEPMYIQEAKDLVYKFNKVVAKDQEKLAYRLEQGDLATSNIDFDTVFFDDYIQIAVYKNKSTASVNVVGKEKLYLRDLEFGQTNAVTICEEGHKVGTMFVVAEYQSIDEKLLRPEWTSNLKEAAQLADKYEFFNDNLGNLFKDDCQFGSLTVQLKSVSIPLMNQGLKKQDESKRGQTNLIFMVRLRIGNESNAIFLGAPDRILDPYHESMTANIDSINDKIYLEFFDVIKEVGFDPKTTQPEDTSNLKLLALKIFDVKDFAFDKEAMCRDHRVLVPIDRSGNVSQLIFNASFVASVTEHKKNIIQDKPYILFLKMIQTQKEVMHHNKDLDTTKMVLVVKNITQDKLTQKRVFFNKEMLSLGSIPFKFGDTLALTFHTNNDDELVPFNSYEFRVESKSLVQILQPYSNEKPATLELRTWDAEMLSLPVNFSKTSNYQKKYQNTIASALQDAKSDIILENMVIEFEARESDFINLASKKNHLESATICIKFDRASLVDLIMSRDLTEQAMFHIQLVSEDKRSIRQKKKFKLSEFDFDTEINLTLYAMNDAVQITIKDEQVLQNGDPIPTQYFVSLELNELPLYIQKDIDWFLQVNTKQIKIELWLDQDVSLLPEEDQKGVNLQDQNQKLDEMQKVETQKAIQEFQQYMNEIKACKDQNEQLAMLKQLMIKQDLKNKKLTTKQLRSKKDTEKTLKFISEAETTSILAAKPPNVQKETNFEAQFRSMVTSTAVKKAQNSQSKFMSAADAKKQMRVLCACGAENPQHRGYCTECVKKMKSKFDALISKYEALKDEFDSFNPIDVEKADEKLKLMRAKAEQYSISLNDVGMLDVMEKHSKLMGTDERKQVADLKVRVMSEQQAQEIIIFTQQIEEEDFSKQQQWFEDQIQLKSQSKKDQESESAKFLYDYDAVKTEIETIEKRSYLKKRYVTQYQALKQREADKRAKQNKSLKQVK